MLCSLHYLECLIEANRELLVDVPGLEQNLNGCRFSGAVATLHDEGEVLATFSAGKTVS